MASGTYFERSFWNSPWQDVVNPDAPLIEIPLGTLSPLFNGWAHQNIDGTYTVFLGEDLVLNALGEPIMGSLQAVVRLSQITDPIVPADILAGFDGPFQPLAIYNAFHQGGEALFDTMFAGDDIVSIEGPDPGAFPMDAPVVETGPGNDSVNGSEHHDEIYAGTGHDTVDGNGGDDILYGQRGRDILHGGSGDDLIYGGIGADTVNGGEGDDVIEGGNGNDRIRGSNGDDLIRGNGGDDFLQGNEGADTQFGGNGADTLRGSGGDDFLDGGLGQDRLAGDSGNDTLRGGGGDDVINGGDGFDTALYILPHIYYQVIVEDVYVEVRALGGNEGTDILFSVERLIFADDVMVF